jgi:hypothetical protein
MMDDAEKLWKISPASIHAQMLSRREEALAE